MAIEARCVDPFATQIIVNRVFIPTTNNPSPTPSHTSLAEDFIPLSMTETPDPISPPSNRHGLKLRIIPEFGTAKSSVKADAGSTSDYNAAAVSAPRSHHKRSRDDAIGDDHSSGDRFSANRKPHKMSKASPFLGHEVTAFEIPGHQSEIHRLISQQTEALARKLKEKDKEIQRIGKLNGLLQEKLNLLVTENKIWRGLAQDNEFEADSLRSNLQHLLSCGGAGWVDDAESHCGQNDPGRAGAEGDYSVAESLRRWGCSRRKAAIRRRNRPGQEM